MPWFIKIGEKFFPPAEGQAPFSIAGFRNAPSMWVAVRTFSGSLLRGVGAWLLIAPVFTFVATTLLYFVLGAVLPDAASAADGVKVGGSSPVLDGQGGGDAPVM